MNYSPEIFVSPSLSSHLTQKYPYTGIVLSSGASKGIIQLGMLHRIFQLGNLSGVSLYVGCSVGSAIALLLCIGYSPLEIFSFACTTDFFSSISQDHMHSSGTVAKIISTGGVCSLDTMFLPLEHLVEEKLHTIPSLSELYRRTGHTLICCSYNLSRNRIEYLSHETAPELNCLDAVKMSCAIPLIFQPYTMNQDIYIDGAMFDSFPVRYAEQYCLNHHLPCSLLGCNVYSHGSLSLPTESIPDWNDWTLFRPLINMMGHMYKVMNAPIHYNMSQSIHYSPTDQLSVIDTISIIIQDQGVGLLTSSQKRFDFFSMGIQAVPSSGSSSIPISEENVSESVLSILTDILTAEQPIPETQTRRRKIKME